MVLCEEGGSAGSGEMVEQEGGHSKRLFLSLVWEICVRPCSKYPTMLTDVPQEVLNVMPPDPLAQIELANKIFNFAFCAKVVRKLGRFCAVLAQLYNDGQLSSRR